jgi:N-alpha-acetyl-L-2,4-diaminobutyrate deacetylase
MTDTGYMAGFGSRELPPRVTATVDFHAPGKQHGYLSVPYSSNDSAWGAVRVPVTVVSNGRGPSILLTGGNHGDEYEGPIALKKLARNLNAEDIHGRVIIMPALNPPAVQQGVRCSPIDGVNMNRSFPGSRTGTVTEMICHYVTTHILTHVDAVIDIHSGGKTLNFVPFAAMHYLSDANQFERTMDTVKAFGAPIALAIEELDTEGMLDGVVESMGKVFVFTELGGGGTASPETVEIAETGVRNVLRHFGILPGAVETRADRGLSPTRLMDTPDWSSYVIADETGLFEPLVNLGETIRDGQAVAQIHSIEKTETPPAIYYAHRNGTLIGRHWPGLARPGDCLAVIGVDRDK